MSAASLSNFKDCALGPGSRAAIVGRDETGKSGLIHAPRLIADPRSNFLDAGRDAAVKGRYE